MWRTAARRYADAITHLIGDHPALHRNDDLARARRHWDQALRGFDEPGVPDAERFRDELAVRAPQ